MNTSELQGAALDWAVAIALGHNKQDVITDFGVYIRIKTQPAGMLTFCPSTDWSQGGPIIEREGIRLHRSHTGEWWAGSEADPQRPVNGPTPLIAAMRCFVATHLGNDVEVPEEFLA